jgi:ParB family chromosome partitioning protein
MRAMQNAEDEAAVEWATIALQDGELKLVHVGAIHASPHPNPNKMRPEQYEALKSAITRFGFAQPVTVRAMDNGLGFEMVDGHHRWQAAQELGLEQIPARVITCNAGEARILAISLNRVRGSLDLAEVGSVFTEVLEGWAGSFSAAADLTPAGFSTDEIDDLLRIASDNVDPTATALAGGDATAPELDEEEDEERPKPFLIEIEFADRAQYQAARRALKRAAGKGKDLAAGLLNVLGIETN